MWLSFDGWLTMKFHNCDHTNEHPLQVHNFSYWIIAYFEFSNKRAVCLFVSKEFSYLLAY